MTKHIWLVAAVFLVLFQNLGQTTLRLIQADGFDKASLICADPGQPLSDETLEAVQVLMDALGIVETPKVPNHEHCSDCVMSTFAVLKTHHIGFRDFVKRSSNHVGWYNPAQFAHKANGPPIGSRAPPRTI